MFLSKINNYWQLMRFNKPVGIFLLLWPTLWALWLASNGAPSPKLLFLFVSGVILMRAAGCVINDLADRDFDRHVQRTKNRPLAARKIHPIKAGLLAAILALTAFILVCCLANSLTIYLTVIAGLLALIYPWLKRVTHWPQLGLGVAFSFGIIMVFAAVTGKISFAAWYVFLTALIWPIIYDTMYAMVDLPDDIKIGIRSTAILFSNYTQGVLLILEIIFIFMLIGMGYLFSLHSIYYWMLSVVAILFVYQNFLLMQHTAENNFRAFLNNQHVGAVIFLGIFLSYYLQ